MKNSYRFVGQAIVFCRLSYAACAEFSMVSAGAVGYPPDFRPELLDRLKAVPQRCRL